MVTKKVPGHIQNNFFYRKVWNDVHRNQKNAMLLLLGNPGTGKSTAGLRICSDIDPSFNINRIVFSVQALLTLIQYGENGKRLKRGSAILFDEAAGSEQGFDARDSLSAVNKRMSYLITIFRSRGLILAYAAPSFAQLDKRTRMIGVLAALDFQHVDFKRKRSIAKFYWLVSRAFSDVVYTPRPRLVDMNSGEETQIDHMTFPLPQDRKLLKEYKQKKDAFIDEAINRWQKDLQEKENPNKKIILSKVYSQAKKEINELVEFTQAGKPRVTAGTLRVKYDLSVLNAEHVKHALNRDIKAGEFDFSDIAP